MIGFCARFEDIQFDSVLSFYCLKARTLVVNFVEIREMRRVRGIFNALEPVAIISFAGCAIAPLHHTITLVYQHVVTWQRWRAFFVSAHVGEDKSTEFLRGIPRMFNIGCALDRLGGSVHDSATAIVAPAVISAANPIGLDDAIFERCAPMRATGSQ